MARGFGLRWRAGPARHPPTQIVDHAELEGLLLGHRLADVLDGVLDGRGPVYGDDRCSLRPGDRRPKGFSPPRAIVHCGPDRGQGRGDGRDRHVFPAASSGSRCRPHRPSSRWSRSRSPNRLAPPRTRSPSAVQCPRRCPARWSVSLRSRFSPRISARQCSQMSSSEGRAHTTHFSASAAGGARRPARDVGTVRTRQAARRMTASATLPNSARETPVRPWVPMTIRSMP